ncbi:hypothetical protein [Nostoc sp.]
MGVLTCSLAGYSFHLWTTYKISDKRSHSHRLFLMGDRYTHKVIIAII